LKVPPTKHALDSLAAALAAVMSNVDGRPAPVAHPPTHIPHRPAWRHEFLASRSMQFARVMALAVRRVVLNLNYRQL
jgi:hypothetical protein